MSDFLLELGKSPRARALLERAGLPIALPERLARDPGPWQPRPLAERTVAVGGAPDAALLDAVAGTLAAAGADVLGHASAPFSRLEEAAARHGGRARALAAAEGARLDGLVFDASSCREPADLRVLYDFFHPLIARLMRSGRVVVLGRAEGAGPAEAAAQAALEGFTRSLAKELGRRGTTANLVRVEPGAEARLEPVLRWLLSARSAFVTAQPLTVSARARGGATAPPFVRPLEGTRALVTGAARGIGEATARLLAEEGAHVLCLDRPADAEPTEALARALGGTALLVDLAAPGAPAAVASAARDAGGLDVVVHNAGITRDKTLAKMTPEAWDEALLVNLGAVVRTNAALFEGGLVRDGGRIVCLSSVAGLAGNVGQTGYAASKAGIVGHVRALATALAGRGITANAIAPGFIETRLTAAMPVTIREAARRLSALGQGGLPDDVAQAITFLASPGAQGITGAVLRVCGGALVGA